MAEIELEDGLKVVLPDVEPERANRWVQFVQQLPQVVSGAVTPKEYTTYINNLHQINRGLLGPEAGADRTAFLLRRLAGFSGTELGLLLAHEEGDFSPFKSARDLILEKLMRKLPEPPNTNMGRGTDYEPFLRTAFHTAFGATSNTDELKRMRSYRGEGELAWLTGTPDDVLTIAGLRVIPDYKVPASGKGDIEQPALLRQYSVQLNTYAWIGQQVGVQADLLQLVASNLPTAIVDHYVELARTVPDGKEAVAKMISQLGESAESFFVTHDIAFDPALQQRILELGTHYHQQMVKGEIPKGQKPTKLVMSAANAAEYQDAAREFVAAVHLGEQAAIRKTAAKERMHRLIDGRSLTGSVTAPSSLAGIVARTNTDAAAALDLCLALGGDRASFVRSETVERLDTATMSQYLATHGVDMPATINIDFQRSGRKAIKPIYTQCEAEAEAALDSVVSKFKEGEYLNAADNPDCILPERAKAAGNGPGQ